ncbi:MAG: hypothetical protein EHM93_06865 [Bacteroidales bacterium]|nr:MAG: hypothetical protein EHM93_06865 [Bacteroidales bacterium]
MKTIHQVILILIIGSTIAGCGHGELRRSKAKRIILEKYEEYYAKNSRLLETLSSKPEFLDIKNEVFYSYSIEILGIQKISDVEVKVEWKDIAVARPQELEKWLSAMQSLKKRLLTLKPIEKRTSGFPTNFYWVFKDQTDGQELLHDITEVWNFGNVWKERPADISKSKEYKAFDRSEQYVRKLIGEAKIESKLYTSTMILYDDGWRIKE